MPSQKKYTAEEARQRKNARQREYAKRTGYASGVKYNKAHGKSFNFRLYTPKDNEMIEWLDSHENNTGYIKDLIREDMKKNL